MKTLHFLTKVDFHAEQQSDLITEYNILPGKHFVNQSYFLYDKSNIIKDTFIMTLNKTVPIYGSFSFFKGKTTKENFTLIDAGNVLKFLVEKNILKNEFKFQLTNISGTVSKIKDNKINNFSIMYLGTKTKLQCKSQQKQS